MSEYIDKRKLLSALNDKCYDMSMPANYYAGFQYAVKIIEKLNVKEEVAPLVHGKWILDAKNHCHCSRCLCRRNIETQIGWNYCPVCGQLLEWEK